MFQKIVRFFRKILRKPVDFQCVIGDYAVKNLLKWGGSARLLIIDGYSHGKGGRVHRVYFNFPKTHKLRHLSFRGNFDEHFLKRVHRVIRDSRSKPQLLVIEGQEDMMIYPVVKFLKNGDKIKAGRETFIVSSDSKKECNRQIQKRLKTQIPSLEEYDQKVLEKMNKKKPLQNFKVDSSALYEFNPQPRKSVYRVVETPEKIKGSGILKERLQTGSHSRLLNPKVYREEVERRLKNKNLR